MGFQSVDLAQSLFFGHGNHSLLASGVPPKLAPLQQMKPPNTTPSKRKPQQNTDSHLPYSSAATHRLTCVTPTRISRLTDEPPLIISPALPLRNPMPPRKNPEASRAKTSSRLASLFLPTARVPNEADVSTTHTRVTMNVNQKCNQSLKQRQPLCCI